MNLIKNIIKKVNCQKGNSTVEIALLMGLVIIPLVTGVMNFGTYINIRHSISRAAMQGSLAASRGEDAPAKVANYLQTAGLDPNQAVVTVTSSNDQNSFGNENTVTITYTSPDTIVLELIPGLDHVRASATTKSM